MALEGDISETHFLYLLDSIILKILSATLLADQTPVLKLKIAKSTVTLNKSACSPQFCQADAGNCWWINQTSSRKQEMSFFTVRAVAGRRAWCWPDLGLILFHCSQCVSLDKQRLSASFILSVGRQTPHRLSQEGSEEPHRREVAAAI